MMKRYIIHIVICLFVLSSCKEDKYEIEMSVEKTPIFTSFLFKQNLNPSLENNVSLTINATSVFGQVKSKIKTLIASFEVSYADSVVVNGVRQYSGGSALDFSKSQTYCLYKQGKIKATYIVSVKWGIVLSYKIPQISIVTPNGEAITSKDTYVKASLTIDGVGEWDDYIGTMQIKGRGNTTWWFPKKPYRLKLDEKSALLGLEPDKDWVLLANYLDYTLMLNAIAMKMGQLMEFPYANHCIPVDVTLNGSYIGNYMLTEKIEIADTRVNISKTDGYILELDSYYDEQWKFYSSNYRLPVMVKEAENMSQTYFQQIKTDFQTFENVIADYNFPNNNYEDYIDINSLVDYYIICNFTQNQEINHPKSTYIHKDGDGKYVMGPLWDFDWGFAYNGNGSYFVWQSSFLSNFGNGYNFFHRFVEDENFVKLYHSRWNDFKNNHLQELYDYIDEYEILISDSQNQDFKKWRNGINNYETQINELRNWLKIREEKMETL